MQAYGILHGAETKLVPFPMRETAGELTLLKNVVWVERLLSVVVVHLSWKAHIYRELIDGA